MPSVEVVSRQIDQSGARLPAGRCMRLSRAKYGSAGVVCLSLFLSSAIGIVMAQEPGEQKDAASGNLTVAASESNEGTI